MFSIGILVEVRIQRLWPRRPALRYDLYERIFFTNRIDISSSSLPDLSDLRRLSVLRDTFFTGRALASRLFIPPHILNPNLRLAKLVSWDPVSWHKIHSQAVRPRSYKKAQRHNHSHSSTILRIGRNTQKRRDHGSTANSAYDKTGAALGVLAQTTHAERDDGREADRLEEECNV